MSHKSFAVPIIMMLLVFIITAGVFSQSEMDGGVLRYGEMRHPETLDPITARTIEERRMAELLFDGLVAQQEGKTVGILAERWEIDGEMLTFWLKKGLKWSDGQEVTGEDVKFTIDVIKDEDTATPLKPIGELIDSVSLSEADPLQIIIRLKAAIFDPLNRFTFGIIPQHAVKDTALTRTHPFTRNPIGTGPFKLKAFLPKEVVLERNPYSVRGVSHLNGVVMEVIPDPVELLSAFVDAKRIDLIPDLRTADISEVQAHSEYTLQPYNSLNTTYFAFNFQNPFLRKRDARQALTHILDRGQLLRALYQGKGHVLSGPYPYQSLAYDHELKPLEYHPQRARSLLQGAGFNWDKDGYLIDEKGCRVSLTLKVGSRNNLTISSLCLVFQKALRELGIPLNLEFQDAGAFLAEVFDKRNFDIALGEWLFTNDGTNLSALFHSDHIEGGSRFNFIGYVNPDIDRLLELSNAAGTESELVTISHKIHEFLREDCPYIYLFSLSKFAVYSNRVRGVTLSSPGFFDTIIKWHIPSHLRRPEPKEQATVEQKPPI